MILSVIFKILKSQNSSNYFHFTLNMLPLPSVAKFSWHDNTVMCLFDILLVRPHDTIHVRRCGLLLQTEWCSLSVCLSVTLMSILHIHIHTTVSPAKTATDRRRLGCGFGWAQGTMCQMVVQIPHAKEQF